MTGSSRSSSPAPQLLSHQKEIQNSPKQFSDSSAMADSTTNTRTLPTSTSNLNTISNTKRTKETYNTGPGPRSATLRPATLRKPKPQKQSFQMDQITPDMRPVLHLFDVFSRKIYIEGYLYKKDIIDSSDDWIEYYVELCGSFLSLWEVNNPDSEIPEVSQTPSVINISNCSIDLSFPQNNSVSQQMHVFFLDSGQGEKFYLQAPDNTTLDLWVRAIRLSCFEGSRLQEVYTATLIKRPGLRDFGNGTVLVKGKLEGYLHLQFSGSVESKKYWVVVADHRAEDKKKKDLAFTRGQASFYEKKSSKKPFMTVVNVLQTYAIYPENPSLIDKTVTFRVEGTLFPTKQTESKYGDFVTLTADSLDEMTKWLFGFFDSFKLYGRPKELLYDFKNPMSPFFAVPTGRSNTKLFLDLHEVEHVEMRESLADIKAAFAEILRQSYNLQQQQHLPDNPQQLLTNINQQYQNMPRKLSTQSLPQIVTDGLSDNYVRQRALSSESTSSTPSSNSPTTLRPTNQFSRPNSVMLMTGSSQKGPIPNTSVSTVVTNRSVTMSSQEVQPNKRRSKQAKQIASSDESEDQLEEDVTNRSNSLTPVTMSSQELQSNKRRSRKAKQIASSDESEDQLEKDATNRSNSLTPVTMPSQELRSNKRRSRKAKQIASSDESEDQLEEDNDSKSESEKSDDDENDDENDDPTLLKNTQENAKIVVEEIKPEEPIDLGGSFGTFAGGDLMSEIMTAVAERKDESVQENTSTNKSKPKRNVSFKSQPIKRKGKNKQRLAPLPSDSEDSGDSKITRSDEDSSETESLMTKSEEDSNEDSILKNKNVITKPGHKGINKTRAVPQPSDSSDDDEELDDDDDDDDDDKKKMGTQSQRPYRQSPPYGLYGAGSKQPRSGSIPNNPYNVDRNYPHFENDVNDNVPLGRNPVRNRNIPPGGNLPDEQFRGRSKRRVSGEQLDYSRDSLYLDDSYYDDRSNQFQTSSHLRPLSLIDPNYYDDRGNQLQTSSHLRPLSLMDPNYYDDRGNQFQTSSHLRPLSLINSISQSQLSAREQEMLARETGTPLINLPERQKDPQTGLVGAITARENQRKAKGPGLLARQAELERERALERERERRLMEQRQQVYNRQSYIGPPMGGDPRSSRFLGNQQYLEPIPGQRGSYHENYGPYIQTEDYYDEDDDVPLAVVPPTQARYIQAEDYYDEDDDVPLAVVPPTQARQPRATRNRRRDTE